MTSPIFVTVTLMSHKHLGLDLGRAGQMRVVADLFQHELSDDEDSDDVQFNKAGHMMRQHFGQHSNAHWVCLHLGCFLLLLSVEWEC